MVIAITGVVGVIGREASSHSPPGPDTPSTPSKPFAWDQNEENAERCINEQRHGEDHDRPMSEKLPDVWLPHPGIVEWGVFAETDEGDDGVQGVLV